MFKPRPSQLPSSSKPISLDRQVGCTHLQVTRLYDPFGSMRCSFCHRKPSLGWLYRCTQDFEGALPPSDFVIKSYSPIETPDGHNNQCTSLSRWLEKDIEKGEYTEEQAAILIQQKSNVTQVISNLQRRPETKDSTISRNSSELSIPPTNTTHSSVGSTYEISKPIVVTSASSPNACETSPGRQAIEIERTPESFWLQSLPHCGFKICATCRPTYRDRAYQSLNAILHNPLKSPPSWEWDNRRLSDAQILSNIGRPRSYLSPAEIYEPEVSEDTNMLRNLSNRINPANMAMDSDYKAYTHSLRSRKRFRETVRQTLKRARQESNPILTTMPNNQEDTITMKGESNIDMMQDSTRSMMFRQRRASRLTMSSLKAAQARLSQDVQPGFAMVHETLPKTTFIPDPLECDKSEDDENDVQIKYTM